MKRTSRPLEFRTPTGPLDYGDAATVGLHVKRTDLDLNDLNADDAFGMYLGEHQDGFVILITDLFSRPMVAEVFPTIEEMKEAWRLD